LERLLIKAPRFTFPTLVLLGLALFTLVAVRSEGFYHADEHFQLLEFANYKLGQTPAADLPWEFRSQIRPTLQPAIAVGVIRAARAAGITSPFSWALLLRLLSGWLAVLVFARIAARLSGSLGGDRMARILFGAAILVWFMPYLSVRFSSENWSALAFLAGLSFLPLDRDRRDTATITSCAVAGLFLGLSFVFRFQMGFALVGVGAWLLFRGRIGTARLAALGAGGLAAIALGSAVDWWFYGNPVFTPWTYFASNIIQGKAAAFGVSPWWWYLPQFLMHAIPPIAAVLLVLAMIGACRARDHVITWAFVVFLVGHVVVGHKELRFLFPMAFPFLFLVVVGWQRIRPRLGTGLAMRVTFGVLAVIDIVALLFAGTQAASTGVTTWRFLYGYSEHRPTTLYVQGNSPYDYDVLQLHFYRAPQIAVVRIDTAAALGDSSRYHPRDGDLLIPANGVLQPSAPGYRLTLVHRSVAAWMLRSDVTHWKERTHIWAVYRIDRR
jgi:phosphatidylinositol glycan class B